MLDFITDLWSSAVTRTAGEDGQTMAEYGVVLALIALVVLVGAQLLGTNVLALFTAVGGAV